jgi:hypothetical protein
VVCDTQSFVTQLNTQLDTENQEMLTAIEEIKKALIDKLDFIAVQSQSDQSLLQNIIKEEQKNAAAQHKKDIKDIQNMIERLGNAEKLLLSQLQQTDAENKKKFEGLGRKQKKISDQFLAITKQLASFQEQQEKDSKNLMEEMKKLKIAMGSVACGIYNNASGRPTKPHSLNYK